MKIYSKVNAHWLCWYSIAVDEIAAVSLALLKLADHKKCDNCKTDDLMNFASFFTWHTIFRLCSGFVLVIPFLCIFFLCVFSFVCVVFFCIHSLYEHKTLCNLKPSSSLFHCLVFDVCKCLMMPWVRIEWKLDS